MDYDRRKTAKVNFDSVVHKAHEANERMREAYLALHAFKFGMDEMDEIPSQFQPLYEQTMKVLDLLHPAQQAAHQLDGMTSKVLRHIADSWKAG